MLLVPYNTARSEILDGDALLFRGRLAGADHYHVGMAAWWHRRLHCLEQVPRYGGRIAKLSCRVAECPAGIDVYGLSKAALKLLHSDPVGHMLDTIGEPYGWWTILRLALYHLPVVRWIVPVQTDDFAAPWPLVCSTRMARAYRLAGADPWPGRSDNMIEPADFAMVPDFFEYRVTLTKG